MNHKYCAILIIIIMLIIIVNLQLRREKFSTRREKAQTIHEWFRQNPEPTYTKYKSDLNKSSNVVEYENILGVLKSTPNFTIESVEKNI